MGSRTRKAAPPSNRLIAANLCGPAAQQVMCVASHIRGTCEGKVRPKQCAEVVIGSDSVVVADGHAYRRMGGERLESTKLAIDNWRGYAVAAPAVPDANRLGGLEYQAEMVAEADKLAVPAA